jgi:hypothetical protein
MKAISTPIKSIAILMRPVCDADGVLRELIANLECRQEGRRAYVAEVEELIERRDLEIQNLRARLLTA